MRFQGLSQLVLAFWLGILALAANAIEQQQLNTNVLEVAVAELGDHGQTSVGHARYHIMPDGRVMMGTMGGEASSTDRETVHHHDTGGHTHRGHSDCEVCGAVAAMAAFTLPVLAFVPLPPVLVGSFLSSEHEYLFRSVPHSSYSSRAPPVLLS